MYYSSDRIGLWKSSTSEEFHADSHPLSEYRKQAIQYIQANRGPTIYFISFDGDVMSFLCFGACLYTGLVALDLDLERRVDGIVEEESFDYLFSVGAISAE